MIDVEKVIAHFRAMMVLLEELFGKDWFSSPKNRNHPAFQRWEICHRTVERSGRMPLSANTPDLPVLARCMLDAAHLVAATKGDADSFTLGPIANLGSESAQAKVRSRLSDPQQFEDLMVELSLVGYFRMIAGDAELLEQTGMPDVCAHLPGLSRQMYVEGKRLCTKNLKRVRRQIQDVNRQLKRAPRDAHTFGVINVTELLDSTSTSRFSDDPPPEVLKAKALAGELLRGGQLRSISKLALIWDSCDARDFPEDGFGIPLSVSVVFVRSGLIIDHPASTVEKIPDGVRVLPACSVWFRLLPNIAVMSR